MATLPDSPFTLLSTTTNETGATHGPWSGSIKSFQATVTGTGALTATATIYCSNNGSNWITLATITLAGTTSATDGFSGESNWFYYRAVSTGVTGTGATLVVTKGV